MPDSNKVPPTHHPQSPKSTGITVNFSPQQQPWIAPPQRYDTTLDMFVREPAKKGEFVHRPGCTGCCASPKPADPKNEPGQGFVEFCGWVGSWFDKKE